MTNQIVVNTGNDSITIVKYLEGIPKGVFLQPPADGDHLPEVIQAGHVVLKNADDKYRIMPITTNGEYSTKPADFEYIGVVRASVLTSKGTAAVMVRGTVNEATSPYKVTPEMKAAMPLIRFTKD